MGSTKLFNYWCMANNYGVTMYIQQKLNPAPPDPVQAKIFMFFPFILTILLASFPSGLVIYWSINNILTMAQQYVIIKKPKLKLFDGS